MSEPPEKNRKELGSTLWPPIKLKIHGIILSIYLHKLLVIVTMGLMFPIYFLSLVLSAGMSLLSAYQILELSDLDCDYINPQRCCANLNRLVVPEILCVGLLVVAHLLTLNWIPVSTTLPMLLWLIYKYRSTPSGYVSLFDATNICDQRVLNKHVRQCLFKVIFHLVHFLSFMYLAIISLITV